MDKRVLDGNVTDGTMLLAHRLNMPLCPLKQMLEDWTKIRKAFFSYALQHAKGESEKALFTGLMENDETPVLLLPLPIVKTKNASDLAIVVGLFLDGALVDSIEFRGEDTAMLYGVVHGASLFCIAFQSHEKPEVWPEEWTSSVADSDFIVMPLPVPMFFAFKSAVPVQLEDMVLMEMMSESGAQDASVFAMLNKHIIASTEISIANNVIKLLLRNSDRRLDEQLKGDNNLSVFSDMLKACHMGIHSMLSDDRDSRECASGFIVEANFLTKTAVLMGTSEKEVEDSEVENNEGISDDSLGVGFSPDLIREYVSYLMKVRSAEEYSYHRRKIELLEKFAGHWDLAVEKDKVFVRAWNPYIYEPNRKQSPIIPLPEQLAIEDARVAETAEQLVAYVRGLQSVDAIISEKPEWMRFEKVFLSQYPLFALCCVRACEMSVNMLMEVGEAVFARLAEEYENNEEFANFIETMHGKRRQRVLTEPLPPFRDVHKAHNTNSTSGTVS